MNDEHPYDTAQHAPYAGIRGKCRQLLGGDGSDTVIRNGDLGSADFVYTGEIPRYAPRNRWRRKRITSCHHEAGKPLFFQRTGFGEHIVHMPGDPVRSEQTTQGGDTTSDRHGKRQRGNLRMKAGFATPSGNMYMSINEARGDDAAPSVEYHSIARPVRQYQILADSGDFIVDDENVAVAQRVRRVHVCIANNGCIHVVSRNLFYKGISLVAGLHALSFPLLPPRGSGASS